MIKITALRLLTLATASFALGALGVSHAHAQASVNFSGGINAPVMLTLNAPVTYLITTASTGALLGFILQDTGNLGNSTTLSASTITYTVNNGTPITVTNFQSNTTIGTVTPTDLILFNTTAPSLAVGDVVRLLAGTATTAGNVAAAAPTATSFQTYLINNQGIRLNLAGGTSVPEPSTWALMGVGAVGIGGVALRRRRARA